MNQQEIPHITFSIYWRRALNNIVEEEEEEETRITIPGPFGNVLDPTTTFKEELGMTQKEYFDYTTGLFKDIETILIQPLIYSTGPSIGFPGIRHFKVRDFLNKLAGSQLSPVILVKEVQPLGFPIGSYQVLSEIRLFLNSGHCFIAPPMYGEGEPQGNYVLSRDILILCGGDM